MSRAAPGGTPESRPADLVLANARVLTMDAGVPIASYVAVKGGRIVGIGDGAEAGGFEGPGTTVIDCRRMTLLPGFIDAHCHLMALASSLRGVDCRPDAAPSIPSVVEAIARRAGKTPAGQWIRAFGYDEFYLSEKRHPTRNDLDRATPDHPVRLDHRTRHATVLNSRALELLGITPETPDPVEGIIDREEATGEPTGLLYEMDEHLRNATGAVDDETFLDGIGRTNRLLLSRGVTSVQDASPGNDPGRWRAFRRLVDNGALAPRVTMMAGASHLRSFLEEGLEPGHGDDGLRIGPVKVMLRLTTGALHPSQEELRETVRHAHRRGYQVAIHAVEEAAVEAAADALLEAQAAHPRPGARHRIEHCSECPPRLVAKVAAAHAVVVTQPSFVYHNGDRYQALIEGSLLPDLYPLGSLTEAGIPVAAGSDAPVAYPDPILDMYSSVTRSTRPGPALAPSQAISVDTALKALSINAAYAAFEEVEKGSIAVGKLADLVLLDGDPTSVEAEEIRQLEVAMTIVGGEVVWRASIRSATPLGWTKPRLRGSTSSP